MRMSYNSAFWNLFLFIELFRNLEKLCKKTFEDRNPIFTSIIIPVSSYKHKRWNSNALTPSSECVMHLKWIINWIQKAIVISVQRETFYK